MYGWYLSMSGGLLLNVKYLQQRFMVLEICSPPMFWHGRLLLKLYLPWFCSCLLLLLVLLFLFINSWNAFTFIKVSSVGFYSSWNICSLLIFRHSLFNMSTVESTLASGRFFPPITSFTMFDEVVFYRIRSSSNVLVFAWLLSVCTMVSISCRLVVSWSVYIEL